ncbi:MAG: glycosyltransferase family 4 protein [Gammaproteobacteria bacterium]
MKIISPMATGNGAFLVHKNLERHLNDYKVVPYHPLRTLFPPALYPIGRNITADLIHTTPDYACFHSRNKVPLVITFHNYVLDRFMRKYSSMPQAVHYATDLRWFTEAATRKAAIMTAVSRFTADLAARDLKLDQEIRVIYNGIDEARFTPVFRKPGKRVRVLFSGNLTQRKGAHWLAPILDRLDSRVDIVYTSGLRSKDGYKAHPRLICLGRIAPEDMPSVYAQADILLFPTVREGLSLAALEAMACGLPLVATDCSSFPELIENGQGGFLCPLGDVGRFAEKINLQAENRLLRTQMGEINRAKIERFFTLNRMLSRYRDLFDEVLSDRA